MTRKELRDVLDDAVGNTPRVDLAEAAWTQGVGMRRRRRAAFAGGGTVLAAAAVVGALVISGGIAPDEDMAPAVPTSTPGPTQVEPGPTEAEPEPTDLSQALTFVFERDGTKLQIETTTLGAALDQQPVPTPEELVGTSWNLVSDIDASGAEEFINYTIADASTVGADVPTALNFADRNGAAILWVDPNGCGGPSYQGGLDLGSDGRFAGQQMESSAVGCPEEEEQVAGFWASALEGGGWLHQPHDDVLLLSVVVPEDSVSDPAPTNGSEATGQPERTDGGEQTETPEVPDGTVSIGEGVGVTPPEDWTYLPLFRGREDAEPSVDTTCLLPPGETRVFDGQCPTGIEIRVGVEHLAAEENPNVWWDPGDPDQWDAPESCYAAPVGYGLPENPVTFDPDPETGTTTVDGHRAEWFRWSATCEEGQEFTAESWRFPDLGIELRSPDGSQDLEPLVETLVISDTIGDLRGTILIVSSLDQESLTGELTEDWPGRWPGTGEQVTLPLTEGAICLVTRVDGTQGADNEVGSCQTLASELEELPYASVIITPEDEVALVYLPRGF